MYEIEVAKFKDASEKLRPSSAKYEWDKIVCLLFKKHFQPNLNNICTFDCKY